MKFWTKRKKSSHAKTAELSLERLEDRAMMAVIPLASGQTATFHDADGSEVKVKLLGPGQGTIELVGGVLTGAAIDTLSLTGTTAASKLKISSRGGSVTGTTVNDVVIDNAIGQLGALKHFKGKHVTLTGDFAADGDIEDFCVRSLGTGANVNVNGNVGRFKAENLSTNAQLEVDGTLREFVAKLLAAGSVVEANQLDLLKIKQQAVGASFDVGEGGLGTAKIGWIYDSSIGSVGNVGEIVVKGAAMGTGFASNIDKGSDGTYGTMDDFVVDPNAQGDIGTIKFRGAVGAAGTSQAVWIVTSGNVDQVDLSGQAARQGTSPSIWTNAANQFVALSILQDTANVPSGRTATGYDDSEIYIAVFGLQILTPPPGVVPTPAAFTTYYLDPTQVQGTIPVAQNTQALLPTVPSTDPVLLPSFTIEQWKDTTGQKIWGSNLAFPSPPSGNQWTGRMLISVGAPVQAQINQIDGTISAPSAANLSDPSTGSFYDFLEFTVTNPNPLNSVWPNNLLNPQIDIDTSMVDAFGLPMRLQLFQDAAATLPYNVNFTGTLTPNSQTITDITNLQELVNNHALGTGQPLTSTTPNAIPAGATITNIDVPNTQITISLPVGAGGNGSTPLTAYIGGPVGVATTRHDILNYLSTDSFVSFLQGKITPTSQVAQPFLQSAAAYPKTAAVPITTGPTPTAGNAIVITTASTAAINTGDVVQVSGVTADPGANGLFTVTVINGTSFSLDSTSSNGAAITDGTWTAFTSGGRLVSPKDVVEALPNAQDTNPLNNYFNETIDDFFLNYFTGTTTTGQTGGGNQFSLTSGASGTTQTYTGTVINSGTMNNPTYVLRLNSSDTNDPNNYDVYYPFFNTNLPTGYTPAFGTNIAPPSWLSKPGESATQMVFACDQVFADSALRSYTPIPATSGVPSTIMGDLENSISAAFNRGISQLSSTEWGEVSQWFPADGTYNYWVEYWHNAVDTYNDLAYAFPYDDKFGASTNLNLSGVGLTQITLGSWSATASATTTEFTSIPTTLPATGTLNLTAQVDGTNPTGTVTFFINGVAINPNDSTSPPLAPVQIDNQGVASVSAAVPALPSGSGAATYTVTAVYSGDPTHLPSIAYSSLALVSNVDVNLTLSSGVLGSSATITTTTPVGNGFNGTLTYTISKSDGSNSQLIAANVPTTMQVTPNTYPIPTDVVTFTGNANGSSMISGISNMTDLMMGQVISGTGVPTGTTIIGLGANSITLSTTVATANGIEFTSNGAGASLPITVSFTPTGSQTPTASGSTDIAITADSYSFAMMTPNQGPLGTTPQMTVNLPGPPYNGTMEFTISRPDGTGVVSMGTVNVDNHLVNGNQVVVETLEIPQQLLTFTGYPASGTPNPSESTITGMSTISGMQVGQTITGTGVPANTTVSGWAPATIQIQNAPGPEASTSPTDPQTLTASNGVTFTGSFTPSSSTFNVLSVHGWDTAMGDMQSIGITGDGLGVGNTIDTYTPGELYVNGLITTSATPITFTSSAENSEYPITAIWTPTGASSLSSSTNASLFEVTT